MQEPSALQTTLPTAQADGLVAAFMTTVDVTSATKHSYSAKLKAFFRWMMETGTKSPKREDILRYKEALTARRYSPLTVSAYLTPLRLFFAWMEADGQYPNITAGIKGAKKPTGFRKESLTVEQVKAVLQVIDKSTLQGKRDFAILNLLFRTGLRTAELIRADAGDIRQEGGIPVLDIQGKGHDSKDDFVLLTEETLRPIYEYLGLRTDVKETAPLFTSLSNNSNGRRLTTRSIRGLVKRYFKSTGLNSPKLTAHSTRHTFATMALLNGAEPIQVKEALRHKDLQTTMIYTHIINRTQDGAEKYIRF